jgi:hypothetical protein
MACVAVLGSVQAEDGAAAHSEGRSERGAATALDLTAWHAYQTWLAAQPAKVVVPFAEVLAGPVPVTVLPDDPVPIGAPDGLAGPVVGGLGRVPGFESPKYWDLATAGTFVDGSAATTESGTWTVDTSEDRGRLTRTGDGPVRVVTALDTAALDEVYRSVFR